jgi:hypothetical protein
VKAAYLLAFTSFLRLVNLALCVKITVKFDRMNYGCPEVKNNIQSIKNSCHKIQFEKAGLSLLLRRTIGVARIVTERFD